MTTDVIEVQFENCSQHALLIPFGEIPDKLEIYRLSFLNEVKKQNNRAVIKNKIAKTFSLQRLEIVEKESGV